MSTLPAIPDQRLATYPPRTSDQYVVTLLDGRPTTFDAVVKYDTALARAHLSLRDHECRMMVLPVNERELDNLFHFDPSLGDPDRLLVIRRLTGIVRDSKGVRARKDACDLLIKLGVLKA